VATDEPTGTHGQIPLRRRLARVGNPLTGSRGQVAIYLAEQGFSLVPWHYPIRTGDSPVCSCGKSPRRYGVDHSTAAGRKKIGKHPNLELSPHWGKDASSDPDQIRRWLEAEPNLNFGLVTGLPHPVAVNGREHELFLLVIDPDSAQAAYQLQADIDMPKTLDVLTGRGLHIYHWSPVPMASKKAGLGIPNVDVKGAPGYVMAPGSLHYSGAIYTSRGRLEDIIMASDDLLEHLIPFEGSTPRRGLRQRITSKREDNVIPLGDKLPKLDEADLPGDVVNILKLDPEEGLRS
jgi:hypothetical protein